MSAINEIIEETQRDEQKAIYADRLMVSMMFGVLGGRLSCGNLPEWEQKQLRTTAVELAKDGSKYAIRILEILEGK